MIFLTFPTINQYSAPLLILVLQGYIFAILLLMRFRKRRHLADLFLGLLLIITGYHRTTYIIGFMDWYDTFRNTKINYILINFIAAIGPLVYFYVKSLTQAQFKFKRFDFIHFLPAIVYFVYRLFIFAYDAQQPGFNEVQNGVLEQWHYKYVIPFLTMFWYSAQLLYYAFAFQLFWWHRQRIGQFFSNTQKVELNWILNFLVVYTSLFVLNSIFTVIDSSVIDLHWTQHWWTHLITSIVLIYVGMKGYFSDYTQLKKINAPTVETIKETSIIKNEANEIEPLKSELLALMSKEQPHLNPDINLTDLSKMLNWSTNTLSSTINAGFDRNFKDFINEYRVKTFQQKIREGAHQQLSLLGIAFESGFNSKATFNRTFKKFTNQTPSEYVKSV